MLTADWRGAVLHDDRRQTKMIQGNRVSHNHSYVSVDLRKWILTDFKHTSTPITAHHLTINVKFQSVPVTRTSVFFFNFLCQGGPLFQNVPMHISSVRC